MKIGQNEVRGQSLPTWCRGLTVNDIIKEIEEKGAVALDPNLILYKSPDGIYFLKVTDYRKGYWAEVPLRKRLLKVLLFFLLRVAESSFAVRLDDYMK